MAERVGFEPTCRLPDKTLSRRPRYDHFGTSPDEGGPLNRSLYPALFFEELLDQLARGVLPNPARDVESVVEARRLQRTHR